MVDLVSPSGTHARVIGGWGYDANVYADYDVWLDDAAAGALHNSADDDPASADLRAPRPARREPERLQRRGVAGHVDAADVRPAAGGQ